MYDHSQEDKVVDTAAQSDGIPLSPQRTGGALTSIVYCSVPKIWRTAKGDTMSRNMFGMMAFMMVASGLVGGLVSRWAVPARTVEAQADRRVEATTFAVGLPGSR